MQLAPRFADYKGNIISAGAFFVLEQFEPVPLNQVFVSNTGWVRIARMHEARHWLRNRLPLHFLSQHWKAIWNPSLRYWKGAAARPGNGFAI